MNFRNMLLVIATITAVSVCDRSTANGRFLNSGKAEVLVVATIHQRHSTDTNYTYRHLNNIISSYNPDVVCVEIRPDDFRKEPYLDEMVMATIWGLVHDKKVYPIDWWRENTRLVRDSLSSLPEYKQKEQDLEALASKDSIITGFEKRFGSWQDQAQQGYEFWNGREYNEYTMEDYRLSMKVFGDSPMNLEYRTRNDSMMARILSVIRENPGSRIIVLTGAEHKHYFDNALAPNPEVALVNFRSLLPLPEKESDPALRAFLDDADDLHYYEKGYPKDLDQYYRAKLIPLLHGPGMDFDPYVVPARNIPKAEKVITRWKNATISPSVSDVIDFELGWLNFQKRDYRSAIGYLSPLGKRIEAGAVQDPFLQAVTHRNLGLCYDCVGERDSALACYKRGEVLAGNTSFARALEILFKDYKEHPYRPVPH